MTVGSDASHFINYVSISTRANWYVVNIILYVYFALVHTISKCLHFQPRFRSDVLTNTNARYARVYSRKV